LEVIRRGLSRRKAKRQLSAPSATPQAIEQSDPLFQNYVIREATVRPQASFLKTGGRILPAVAFAILAQRRKIKKIELD
jgi:hypothetical protein